MAASEPTLAVAVIVRNEAERLRLTLNSIHEHVDEIVVLDTGSTDPSPQIAEELGAVVRCATWTDDFSAARNECLRAATADWILWLDAGETLAEDDAAALKRFVRRQAKPDRAYLLLVEAQTESGNVDHEQIGLVRLAPRRDEICFVGRVRESMLPSLNDAGIEVEGVSYRIVRDLAANDPERKRTAAQRNLKLADLQIAAEGPTPRILNCQAEAFLTLGDFERSIDLYQRALEISEPESVDLLEAFCGILSSLDHRPEAVEAQLEICLKALEVFPVDAQLLCAMASYLQKQGRLDVATRSYQTAFQYGQIQPQLWHVASIHEIAAVCCSLALQLQNKAAEAESVLREAIAGRPDSPRLQRQMIALWIKEGRREEAIDALQSLSPPEDAESVRVAVRGACLAAKKDWEAAIPYLGRDAYDRGYRDVLCLRWLSVAYLSTSDVEAAGRVLQAWNEIHPDDVELRQYLSLVNSVDLPHPSPPHPSPPAPVGKAADPPAPLPTLSADG